MSKCSMLCFVQEVQLITLNIMDYIKLKPHSQWELSAYSLALLQLSLTQDVNSSQVWLTYLENLFFRWDGIFSEIKSKRCTSVPDIQLNIPDSTYYYTAFPMFPTQFLNPDSSVKGLHRLNTALQLQVGLTIHKVVWEMFDLSDLPNISWKNPLQWYSTDFPKWGSPYFSPISFKIRFLVYATNKAKSSTDNNLHNCETMIDFQCLSKGK